MPNQLRFARCGSVCAQPDGLELACCSVWVLGVGVGVLPAHPDPVLSCPVSYSYPESFTRAYFLN